MISVVIPLYNKEHVIVQTLKSVLSQTYTKFEVIIVNDGSTDNGVDIIKNFTNDSRLRIINQENQGVSVARNVGVENSKYNYIAFLDGDDKWLPNYLEKMKEAIDQFPDSGMFCCGGVVENSNQTVSIRLAKKYKDNVLKINFFENPHVFLHTSATIVKKEVFEKTQGFPIGMKRNQDFALFFSIALITPVVYCGFPLSVYVGGVEGQATSASIDQIIKHKINRHNLVFGNWLKSPQNNTVFTVFLKYELRHDFINQLKKKNYHILNEYLNGLRPEIIDLFPEFEKTLYIKERLRTLGILFILITKIRWRLRGYPIVGEITEI